MAYKVSNNAFSTLGGAINSIVTSLTVGTGHGDRFPVITGSDHTFVTLENASGNIEIVKVTARATASDVMTIVRAQDGTTARSWAAGDVIECRVIASLLNDAIAHAGDTTDAHAASAITNTPAGNIAATTVQAALNELDSELSAGIATANSNLTSHLNDTSDAHDASAISYAGGTGMSATDVEAAIDELATEKMNLAGGTLTGNLTMSGASIITAEGASVTAAATTNIWATDGNTRHVTGNTTITSFGTAPQAGARMRLIFDGTPTLIQSANLNLNGGGSNITIEADDWAEVYADTTTQFDVMVHRKNGAIVAQVSKIQAITATVSTNALTATINAPFSADFRSTTLNNGVPNSRVLAANASVVAPSGATFGAQAVVTVSSATAAASTTLTLNTAPSSPVQVGDTLFIGGVQSAKVVSFGTYAGGTGTGTVILDTAVTVTASAVVFCHPTRLLLLAIDNAGTIEAALVNQSGGLSLDETGLISTTAISAGATANNVVYSTTARSNVPYKVVGFVDVVQAANGVYAVAPALVQGATASAMAAMWSIGNGQIWTDVKLARVTNLNYVNSTGRPIQVTIVAHNSTSTFTLEIDGLAVDQGYSLSANDLETVSSTVPPGSVYRLNIVSGVIDRWIELR